MPRRGSNREHVTLPCEAASSGAARRFVLATLLEWDCHGVVDSATLVASELVTNVVLHARTDLEVVVERQGEGARIEVADGSPMLPSVKDYGVEGSTGRGLRMVAAVAAEWGVSPRREGKVVWVELEPDPRYEGISGSAPAERRSKAT